MIILSKKINSRNLTYKLGHNKFSGMDDVEYRRYLSPFVMNGDNGVDTGDQLSELNDYTLYAELPAYVNWVEKGAVTTAKDQGQCGSCWSFSTTGALEGVYYLKYGRLESFSEQQLVDCDSLKYGGHDHGCNGGLMDNAFTWISKNGGLCKESDYPYVSGITKTEGICQKGCTKVAGSTIVKYVDVAHSSDTAMMNALAQQPVSVAIEADQREFQLYKSGVFTGACGTNLDHGVLAVGYGTLDGLDYYTIKNSWGTSWGENGYIKIGRGSSYNSGNGQCGVLLQASYPLL